MSDATREDAVFEKTNPFTLGDREGFDGCTFKDCDLSGAELGGQELVDCRFVGCNLSNARLGGATLNGVAFAGCKLLGVDFAACNRLLLRLEFSDCKLDYAGFRHLDLRRARFERCGLVDADFSEANLAGVKLADCDLAGARFSRTNLERADLTTARNYVLDPTVNKVRKARFSLPDVLGLLEGFDIVVDG